MADPATLAVVSMGASAGGGILSAFGAAKGGNATADMYAYQAGIADMRRRIALQNRDFALQEGGEAGVRYGLKARYEAGKIRAAQSASGIDMGSGSPVKVREGQRMITEMDTKTIAENTARRAYGFETQAATEAEQGRLYSKAADSTRSSIPLKVMSSLLSSATSVSSKWLQGSQSGLFGSGTGAPSADSDPTYSNYGFGYT